MSRIPAIDPATATGEVRALLTTVQESLGAIPNLHRVVARSPAALQGVLGLAGALARGRLRPRLREQLALAVAQANGCDYCLSAHTALGRGLRLTEADLARAREGRAADPRDDAALRLAARVVERRGRVSDAELAEARRAGLDDGEVVEIVAHVALNVFTNYFNRAAQTEIDFPLVTAGQLA